MYSKGLQPTGGTAEKEKVCAIVQYKAAFKAAFLPPDHKKCLFFKDQLKFQGQIVIGMWVETDPAQTGALTECLMTHHIQTLC